MPLERVLVANRGEIAARIVRAAGELGLTAVAVYAADDADAHHVWLADEAVALAGSGPSAYTDGAEILRSAHETGCDAVHPGYGFLSENAEFARDCVAAGLVWIGPEPETVAILGDKTRAKELAERSGVPVLAGTTAITTPEDAGARLEALPRGSAAIVKPRSGSGGTGMRIVRDRTEMADAVRHCQAAARTAFGSTEVFVEQFLPRARHIEVQIAADACGAVAVLGDRDCSLQHRGKKLIEIAPAPDLDARTRTALAESAALLARAAGYLGLGTVEFLLDTSGTGTPRHYFLEANPRLQVEHTVTEEVTGVDLVQAQLLIAAGADLGRLGLRPGHTPEARGCAVQVRISTEVPAPSGPPLPQSGTLTGYVPPGGPGVRVDGCGYPGYRVSTRYDTLLAKLIARDATHDPQAAVRRARRALREFRIEGVRTNRSLSEAVLALPDIATGRTYTALVDELVAETAEEEPAAPAESHHDGSTVLSAPVEGTVTRLYLAEGARVTAGATLAVLEAMKMEYPVTTDSGGTLRAVLVQPGEVVGAGQALAHLDPDGTSEATVPAGDRPDPEHVRTDLEALFRLRERTTDDGRPEAVARRHAAGRATARENIERLCDEGSFVEYGGLALAAQRSRRSEQELMDKTPADGLVAGVGSVNGATFGPERSRVVALSYDYTVLAGTQGARGHIKKDRMFSLAERSGLPVVLFAEGGGGRPGDTDGGWLTGLDCEAFARYAALSGTVPLIGIASGRCFAGNAALLGCSDVVIATRDATIGMGGPAMIEGAGLGVFRPEEVGPVDVQRANGVVDIPVADDAEAVASAQRYLSYFQGPLPDWEHTDQRLLRHCVPENRKRVYDVRDLITTLADTGSVLELRRDFGASVVTSLARVQGRPIGLLANDPAHLGGAIDSDAADKAARFMQLCDGFGLPVLSLVDTPGFMVGPDSERTAAVRHLSRMFVTAGSMSVPTGAIVLRKGYGLGSQAMAGGGFRCPRFVVAWPTGELGAMGLEGAVHLGYRDELDAITDPAERKASFDAMVDSAYEHGRATRVASAFEIDDVIDPAESRGWITSLLTAAWQPAGGRRPYIDTW
ncbi:ATP-grasp domain-containing protein [Haloechinothrix sp. YIM 98757]|uniref:acetyl-CoA carboxylase n=1 Tax=Haloechinothrix aidingensis TaxID=2752311 RepID=A0A838A5H2_9PSEU|nr:ATP-grasp domain-containing protein [Haloechinothrix aidingensis]